MAVPTWIWFVEPVLRELAAASGPMERRALKRAVPERMGLSEADRQVPAGQGAATQVVSRTGWALAYASMAGLVEAPARARWQLTEAGRSLLARYPSGLPETVLREIERKSRPTPDAESEATAPRAPDESDDATPDERFLAAYEQLRASTREALLTEVRAVAPAFFERIVLDLLHKLGYGAKRSDLALTSAGADGGIDGVISLDRLGLEKVYVQAKRYAEDNIVGRPAVQSFLGVLAGRRATKGIFITTSRFSSDARAFALSASDNLVLIEGQHLAELMMDHEVGVSVRQTFKLVTVDSDYFEGE